MNMLATSMIQVSPQIKLKPFQHEGHTYTPESVRLTGMRIMIVAHNADGEPLWKDFPTSHGLYAPCVFNPRGARVTALPTVEWWSKPLRRLWDEPPVTDTKIQIHRCREAK